MMHVFFWLVQDLLTVLTWGSLQIPEIYLCSLVYRLLTGDREVYVPVIWFAFIGGLFWDLRWVGIPGFFLLNYVCISLIVIQVWNTLPLPGRTRGVVFLFFWTAQVIPTLLAVPFLGRSIGNTGWTSFAVQQGCIVPLALLGVFSYSKHMKDPNA